MSLYSNTGIYELSATYSKQQSFYGKALVRVVPNGDELYSYGTLVASVINGKPTYNGRYSNTTTRHQLEYFRQHGFNVNSSKDMEQLNK